MRLHEIKPLSDAALRFEMGQLMETFVVNMLKDLLRANYQVYQGVENQQSYCIDLIEFGFTQIFLIGANDPRVWETVATPLGEERKLTRFGWYLASIYRRYKAASIADLIAIIDSAREKVG